MTKTEYLAALKALDLGRASLATAKHLGLSRRQIQKYVADDPQDIPETVAKLLRAYMRHPRLIGKV